VPESKCSLLIVDDERHILTTLSGLLDQDFEVLVAQSSEEALELLSRRDVDLVLSDQRMPRMSGVQLLEWVGQHRPKTVRLLMTGFGELHDAVEAINRAGVFRYIFKPWRVEEIRKILLDAAHAFQLERRHDQLLVQYRQLNEELEKRVQQRTQELEEANRQLHQKNAMLERLALTDELTGLPNRRAIEHILRSEIRRRSRYRFPLAIGLIDADHFKDINTRYLYPGGDQVLIALGKTLTNTLRGVDTVGRVGGEEFLVVTPETNFDGACVMAERLRLAVETTCTEYQGERIGVTVSVGFAVAESDVLLNSGDLVHLAAAALAEAKARGRNLCVVWPAGQPLGGQDAETPDLVPPSIEAPQPQPIT
jgi:diguanylate cyclase